MDYITFTKPTESKSTVPRIGGKSFIPDHLWPKDENENAMLFIASIPAETVILYLSDAVGYVFIKKELKINKIAGLYFGQCT
ncbi:hypothetical protein [Chryseobacterium sp.]|uniref:hypothetical protein n=1 Tax=Chryseobacterium sp. TaxID=1871047 RepID=UPI000ED470DD|nr:hypothetical protein [Chryseobacterium sp.]HCM35690.1 hypothetical protein [Chryseobacterium sp.]